MDLSTFIAEARAWLDDHAEPLTASAHAAAWGAGSDDVQVFHDLTDDRGAPAAVPRDGLAA